VVWASVQRLRHTGCQSKEVSKRRIGRLGRGPKLVGVALGLKLSELLSAGWMVLVALSPTTDAVGGVVRRHPLYGAREATWTAAKCRS
jgi:hypothetical protein